MSNELETILKEIIVSWPASRYYPDFRVERLRKAEKISSQDSHRPGRDSNLVPPEWSPEVLLPEPVRSIGFYFFKEKCNYESRFNGRQIALHHLRILAVVIAPFLPPNFRGECFTLLLRIRMCPDSIRVRRLKFLSGVSKFSSFPPRKFWGSALK